ncbi:hypothetical protein DW070_08295 [Coprococcus catus]|uniref:Phosphotriesterase n=1 Tax=Coprococcus catus TaxID=116085 RepID=A0A3E2TNL2_9FIRM|nr:hypothetical protein DW070_08295 [Coprococcus catus]
MSVVQTLNGAIDSSEMGYTLSHEHIFVHDEGLVSNFPSVWNEEFVIQKSREKIIQAYEAGVRTILDASVLGNGRNVAFLKKAMQGLPMNIIVCTGTFYKTELPGFFMSQDIDVMTKLFVKDITEGIGDTGVKAAVVKACTDYPGVTFGVEKALRAAARAHLETGAVLHTHAHAPTQQGLAQQKIFKEEGVDLSKVYIGHAINSDDMDYLHGLLDQGSFIGFDRWAAGPLPPVKGMPEHPPVTREKAVNVLAKLLSQGYEDQILIGNDACCWQTVVRFETEENSPELYTNSYLIFVNEVSKMLLEAGVTERQLHKMTVDNPRRLFECNAQ